MILTGVSQDSDIESFLYNTFKHNIPKPFFTELNFYVNDTAIVASNENPFIVFSILQRPLKIIDLWIKR